MIAYGLKEEFCRARGSRCGQEKGVRVKGKLSSNVKTPGDGSGLKMLESGGPDGFRVEEENGGNLILWNPFIPLWSSSLSSSLMIVAIHYNLPYGPLYHTLPL